MERVYKFKKLLEFLAKVLVDVGTFIFDLIKYTILIILIVGWTFCVFVVISTMRFLEKNLKFYSRKMLVWIKKISHPDGKIPFFNDATFGVTSEISFLREYYYRLNKKLNLKEKK